MKRFQWNKKDRGKTLKKYYKFGIFHGNINIFYNSYNIQIYL